MKNIVLTKQEKAIERDFNKYRPVSRQTRSHIHKILENSRRSRPISLRINESDLKRLKQRANRTGLPYQTMINVVLHKYVTDSYLDKEEIDKFLQLKKAS